MEPKDALWQVGVGRTCITPFPGVELSGLGYFLERTWDRIQDDLHATALVISGAGGESVAFVALDILYIDAAHVQTIRSRTAARTGLRPESICVNASHSHNAPTMAFFDGAGEIHPDYVNLAIDRAVEALETAWNSRCPARLQVGATRLSGMTFNRTREGGAVDERLGVLRADALDGRPIAIAVNFHAHPTVFSSVEPRTVTRDCVGRMIDSLEEAIPGVTALYLQGSCGDVNYLMHYWTREHYQEVGQALFEAAQKALEHAREIRTPGVRSCCVTGKLPARHWTREEVMEMYEEAKHRLDTGDTEGWIEGFASRMVTIPQRLPGRYGGSVERAVEAVSRFAVRWAEDVLPKLETMPEVRPAEFQAMRIGDFWVVTNESEFFSSLALEIRRHWPHQDLFILGYSNGSTSYLPDAYEVDRRSYASLHVAKAIRQPPFTRNAGRVAVETSLRALQGVSGL